MILKLTQRQSALVAIVLAASAAAAVIGFILLPIVSSISDRWTSAALLKKQRDVLFALSASFPSKEAGLKALQDSAIVQGAFHRAASPDVASAQFQGTLSQMVQTSGCTLNAAQVLPDGGNGAGRQLALALNVSGTIAAQTKLLEAIASASPRVSVKKYILRDPDGDWASAKAVQEPNILLAEMTLFAFYAPD